MKKYLFVFLFLSFLLFQPVKADEANISYQRLEGIYFNLSINGNFQSNHVTSFHLNDRIAYCIEPGVSIDTKIYDVNTNWDSVNFSDDVIDYIEKVGYYGYEYPGHQNNRYYIAAQELIWKAINPNIDVLWTSGINKTGDVIDVSAEKSEIENLVNNHSLLPSFAFDKVKGYLGEEIVLTDENNVLDFYDISESKNHVITKDGNRLIIKLSDKKSDLEEINLNRIYYDKAPLLVYSRGDSQKLAALRITMDKNSYFTIENEELPEEIVEVPNTGKYLNNTFDNIILSIKELMYAINNY